MNPVQIDTALNGSDFVPYFAVCELIGNRWTARFVGGIYETIKETMWQFISQLYGDVD